MDTKTKQQVMAHVEAFNAAMDAYNKEMENVQRINARINELLHGKIVA